MIEGARTIDDAVAELAGPDVRIVRRSPVGGGCIANGTRLGLSNGEQIFAKSSTHLPAGMFRAEAIGLAELRCDDGPRVPRPLALGADDAGGFLLMEWVETGRPPTGFHERFGADLARLHRSRTADRCGFRSDNFIGSTPQLNTLCDRWSRFFAERRIGFQVSLARDHGRIDARLARSIESIMVRMADLLPEPERPALLHGDLWGGNYLCDTSGTPVLIDPAVYYGHPEADLAMTELFGGFPPPFYGGYRTESPVDPGYADRRDLYNLYHLLNHLNIFGGGYLSSVRSVVVRYA